ncbi:TMEM143 family protein [Pleurocapsa sp. PCC 7319]|uniref:TMEM143 family protein n=1 Tax=Pleurocapsa sp. PCC 7319 TaxID=118161 RepID=UPI00034B476A|nr:TMEM143 family protein [Pleurocapsa sp. PCC 7319]
MAVYQDREAFIPYSRQEIVELCIADGKIAIAEQQSFRDFCQILAAYYHFKLHSSLETLKFNFVSFDPDIDNYQPIKQLDVRSSIRENEVEFISTFTTILEQANYYPLSKSTLQQALSEGSIFDLRTEVDFNDFDHMVCYCRGDSSEKITVKKWFFKKVEQEVDIYKRVVLLIKFKEEKHFQDKPAAKEELDFKPGKIYIYLYKNLSKLDLEFIFPNVKMSMNWKDRLLFGVPALGAAIPLILRILPQIILILGVLVYFTLGHQPIDELKVQEEEVRNIAPLLIAILSLVVTLGGFAFKQYTSYKSKQIKFQKSITETLFYRNIANNSGVFNSLIDAAEEEECKEIILAYYHLLTSDTPLTALELDDHIESWMEDKLGTKIDFDIENPLRNLAAIKAEIKRSEDTTYAVKQVALLKRDRHNRCQVLPLAEAKQAIDYVWDHIFLYS